MAAGTRRRTIVAWSALALALGVAVLAWALRELGRPLPVIGQVPAFALVDQHGSPFGNTALDGRVWIASFIYTRCEGPCPIIVERLGRLARDFDTEPDLQIVSFSVDPQYDTPTVLADYARRHHIDGLRWKLLTGDPDRLFDLIRHGFFLPVESAAGGDAQAAERVTHSVRLVLVDRRGRMRGYYDSGDADELARLEADTRRLLRENDLT